MKIRQTQNKEYVACYRNLIVDFKMYMILKKGRSGSIGVNEPTTNLIRIFKTGIDYLIVSCDLTNCRNLMKLRMYLDNLTGNTVLKFDICTIDILRDIEKSLIFGKLEFIPNIIKIHKKFNTSFSPVSSH